MYDSSTFKFRQYQDKREELKNGHRGNYVHAHPDSVFIAQIGANYDPGCWQALMDMLLYTQQQGIQAWMEEITPQQGSFPFVDIAGMRDSGVMQARSGGFEYVCLIDSDTKPEPDTLAKLIAHDIPIVAPYIIEPGVERMLGAPEWGLGEGLRPARWVCASMILFKTSVFNCPNTSFKTGTDDDLFFQQLWVYGHRPYIDTNVQLEITKPPQRPGQYTWDERWAIQKRAYTAGKTEPDRRPVDPDEDQVLDGVYIPYGFAGANANGR